MESPIDRNGLFSGLYGFFAELTPDGFGWLAYLLAGGIVVFIVVNGVLLLTAADTYMERRVLGRFQTRLGPNRVGPFGLLQPLADVLKLIMKEDLRPAMADRLTFFLAPVLMVAAILLAAAVVPFGPDTFLADLNIGVLYFVGIPTIATVAMFLGGWGSGNRFALLGAARAVAMLISYEVPMIVSLAGVLLLAGSMSLVDVVEAQQLPFIVLQPLGFFVFLVAASAEMNRTPFDLMEAESELTAGFHTEYSGIRFALLQLAEFGELVIISAVLAVLFLSGWKNPFVSPDLRAVAARADMVPWEARLLPAAVHMDPRDAAPHARRPGDGLRVESALPIGYHQHAGDGRSRRRVARARVRPAMDHGGGQLGRGHRLPRAVQPGVGAPSRAAHGVGAIGGNPGGG